jgi:hypothetical protein
VTEGNIYNIYLLFNKYINMVCHSNLFEKLKRKFQMKAVIIPFHYNRITLKLPIMYKNVTFLFPTGDLLENIREYYEMNSILLPLCTAAKTVKATYKYCSRVLGCHLNPFTIFIITRLYFNFVI